MRYSIVALGLAVAVIAGPASSTRVATCVARMAIDYVPSGPSVGFMAAMAIDKDRCMQSCRKAVGETVHAVPSADRDALALKVTTYECVFRGRVIDDYEHLPSGLTSPWSGLDLQ